MCGSAVHRLIFLPNPNLLMIRACQLALKSPFVPGILTKMLPELGELFFIDAIVFMSGCYWHPNIWDFSHIVVVTNTYYTCTCH